MASKNWTVEELKLAFYLYCQLPFGKLDARTRDVVELARRLERTPGSVAMKLNNFASLDPAITGTGRKGLSGASTLDRQVWADFHADWDALATECDQLQAAFGLPTMVSLEVESDTLPADYSGETRQVLTQVRKKQAFFRKMVLSSYGVRCCMSGVSDPRLLIASHIVSWASDKANRLNPRNGLCLSAWHDRAFDAHLIALDDNCRVLVSPQIAQSRDEFLQRTFGELAGKQIDLPTKFQPDLQLLARHRESAGFVAMQ